jgi:hypothetical protein
MERDIMLCTGCIPEKLLKLSKTLQNNRELHVFLNLVKNEGHKINSIAAFLPFKK